jgi:hypothetical protein
MILVRGTLPVHACCDHLVQPACQASASAALCACTRQAGASHRSAHVFSGRWLQPNAARRPNCTLQHTQRHTSRGEWVSRVVHAACTSRRTGCATAAFERAGRSVKLRRAADRDQRVRLSHGVVAARGRRGRRRPSPRRARHGRCARPRSRPRTCTSTLARARAPLAVDAAGEPPLPTPAPCLARRTLSAWLLGRSPRAPTEPSLRPA